MAMDVVRIADLKARLSEHLRAVRRGRTIIIVDGERAIARIVPYDGERARLSIPFSRAEAPPLHRVRLPPALRLTIDVVDLLAEP